MATVYLRGEKSQRENTSIIDSVLVGMRKELRSDLSGIARIDWGKGLTKTKR